VRGFPRRSQEKSLLSVLRVALIVSTVRSVPRDWVPPLPHDGLVELDTEENIASYTRAFQEAGHEVVVEEGTPSLPRRLAAVRPDICFNLAEGFRGEDREAHVPALLEMLGLRYTGPGPLGAAITLDKPVTKHILRSWNLPTPAFQVFQSPDEVLRGDLRFPLFAKPAHEGGGMGISNRSLCHNPQQLRECLTYLVETYREPVLVESYIEGREISCGVVGNEKDLHFFPINEVDFSGYPRDLLPIYGSLQKFQYASCYRHICPAELGNALTCEVRHLAEQAFRALRCRDFARVDFRLDRGTDRPSILEVNSLPGIAPSSDLTLMAEAEGWTHGDLVRSVLNAALKRYGMNGEKD
jgi:D-alanine-D-alanine ligase